MTARHCLFIYSFLFYYHQPPASTQRAVDVLNRLREGICDEEAIRVLQPSVQRGTRLANNLKKKQSKMALAAREALNSSASGSNGVTAGADVTTSTDAESKASSLSIDVTDNKTNSNTNDNDNEDDEGGYTWLMTRKRHVEDMNARQLHKIPGVTVTFKAKDSGSHAGHLSQLDKVCPARQSIELKVGARVMLLKNLNVNEGLCNGSLGIVAHFNHAGWPVVYFTGIKKNILVEREVWPLKVRYWYHQECFCDSLACRSTSR